MPYIVSGDPSSWKDDIYTRDHYDYSYPNGLDFKPGSKLHNKIRSMIWQRAQESRTEMSKRFSSWREIDKTLTAYIPIKDKEIVIQKKDHSKPVSIVFPYSYSMLEALLTYLTMAFFQDPMFQYEGVEDNDTVGAMMMEMVVRLHCNKSKVALNIHTVLRDALGYGIGVGAPYWNKVYGRRVIKGESQTESELGNSSSMFAKTIDNELIFEGNALSNVDPYMWLPDPSAPSSDIQRGEYVGWIDRSNFMDLLSEESNDPGGDLFNVRYLGKKKDKRSSLAMDQSERNTRIGGGADIHRSMSASITPIDRIKMYVKLIPKEWGLGDIETPQKWYFELASDDLVISAHRADYNHGKFPIAVASPEFDGYSATPIGRMEVLYGLQHTLDFLFNSHISNVRKAVNDMLIVDPYLVNIEDLKDPQPGKLIRLRRPAWGRGVDKVVQQLAVQDITRANISDSAYITQWMDRISGADQSMQGALRMSGPERLTGSEFQGTRSSAISRLQRLAMIIGMQFMQDIGTMFAVHTQQFMSQDTYVRVTSQYADKLENIFGNKKRGVKVSLYDLAVNYDTITRDGSIPGGNFSQSWIELFKVIGANPQLMQEFDISRIFMYIASQLGAKNVEDFKRNIDQIQTQTMPDAQVASQVQAGNLVPVGVQ